MIHTIFGFAIIIMATVVIVDVTAFPTLLFFLLTVNIVGGVASVVRGLKGGGD